MPRPVLLRRYRERVAAARSLSRHGFPKLSKFVADQAHEISAELHRMRYAHR